MWCQAYIFVLIALFVIGLFCLEAFGALSLSLEYWNHQKVWRYLKNFINLAQLYLSHSLLKHIFSFYFLLLFPLFLSLLPWAFLSDMDVAPLGFVICDSLFFLSFSLLFHFSFCETYFYPTDHPVGFQLLYSAIKPAVFKLWVPTYQWVMSPLKKKINRIIIESICMGSYLVTLYTYNKHTQKYTTLNAFIDLESIKATDLAHN